MAEKTRKATPVGRETVRRRLGGLSIDEIEDAVASGLLIRLPDRRFDAESVEFAVAMGAQWRQSLHDERRLNATEAASRLGVPVERFRRAVKAGQISPVASMPWKWGTIWFYRGADVDALAGWLTVDAASRHVAAVSKRSAAARKGAATRRRNAAAAAAAREKLAKAEPGEGDSAVLVVRYVTAMLTGFGYRCQPLEAFTRLAGISELAHTFVAARIPAGEQEAMRLTWRDQGIQAAGALVKASDLNRSLGLAPGTLPGPLAHLGGWVSRHDVEMWIVQNPDAVERARRKEQERQMLESASQLAAAEARRIEQEATRLQAEAFLLTHEPGEGAHPAVRLQFAVMVATALDGMIKDLSAPSGPETTMAVHEMRRILQGLDKDRRREVLAHCRDLASDARSKMRILTSPHRFRARRIETLELRGLVHYDYLVVPDEVAEILRDDPEMAARWTEEDAVEKRRVAKRNEQRAAMRAARAAKRNHRRTAKRDREARWRERWAAILEVPVAAVPVGIGNPTEAAIRSLKRNPPDWLTSHQRGG